MATNTSEALDVVGPENLGLACQQMAETIRGQLRCRARASRCITVGACRRSGRIAAPGRVNGGGGLGFLDTGISGRLSGHDRRGSP
jgi:hypothetical protein